MLILGIDPGTATVGYGLVEVADGVRATALAYGIIQTDKHMSMPERLKVIHEDLSSLLEQDPPDVMVVEELFFFRNFNTAIPVAQARGVILLAAAQAGVPVVGYTPMQVKLTVSGHGHAQKAEVQEAIRDLLQLESIPRPDDAADALSLALTHWQYLEGTGETPKPSRPAPRAKEAPAPWPVEIEAYGAWDAVLTGGAAPELAEAEHHYEALVDLAPRPVGTKARKRK